MSGLKITRTLAPNPIRKKKAAKKKRRTRTKRRRVKKTSSPGRRRSSAGKSCIRAVTSTGKALYWTGKKWSANKSAAKKCAGPWADEIKAARKKPPAGWVVMDVLPA